jgi:putative membrane protein
VHIAATVLIAVIALLHVWFAILEMVLWTKPLGIKTFGRTQQQADDSASLAMNQGLYNLFLVAGLVWSLVAAEPTAHALRLFFLGCVVVAGIFGGLTASRKILFVQAAPAAVALALVLAAS